MRDKCRNIHGTFVPIEIINTLPKYAVCYKYVVRSQFLMFFRQTWIVIQLPINYQSARSAYGLSHNQFLTVAHNAQSFLRMSVLAILVAQ